MRGLYFLLLTAQVLGFAITPLPSPTTPSIATTTSSPFPTVTDSEVPPATTAPPSEEQLPLSALVTLAAVAINPLEKRQRCFDDRGFNVDCATWTGYYYTWGPPGNPYLGGPGEGGGGSGGGGGGSGGSVVVVGNSAVGLDICSFPAVMGFIGLGLVLYL